MVNIFWLRPKIGDAVWLWQLLNGNINFAAQGQPQWFSVMDGKPINDLQIGAGLYCTADTVKEWRERLEAAGLIRCTAPEPDASGFDARKYEVVNVNFGAPTPGSSSPGSPLTPSSVN